MIKINPESIKDLLTLKDAGIPVTLTSHPGNASLYKLTLWVCGIPEHLWDVTCCKADANNWPMHRLIKGEAELLVSEEFYQKVLVESGPYKRFVTAYQFTKNGERLARFHVRVMEFCFPGLISSCSRLLLSETERVREMFEYLADTRRGEVFTRYISSEGVMRPIAESGIKKQDLAGSFMHVLRELDHLLFSDEPIITRGGACYDDIMVPLAGVLVHYWKTGRVDRYDISGPDMIHYAMRKEHQIKLTEMLKHLRKWSPKLVPENIIIQMFPGTVARVGYVPGHISQEIMQRKIFALRNVSLLDRNQKRSLWEIAKDDERNWPIRIEPNTVHYFSQHDLALLGKSLVVDDFWKDLPIKNMMETLQRANSLLRIK